MTIPARLRRHVKGLWPDGGAWLAAPLVAWPLGNLLLATPRWEHVLLVIVVPLLAYGSASSKRLFLGLLPIGILGLVYDAMRFVKHVGVSAASIHDCDLRALDMRIASVTVDGVPGSVHDWLQRHPSPVLDVICAVPYATHIFVALAFAVLLYVRRDDDRLRAFGWTFLFLNLAGFLTYHVYPAAPPWYFHAHGCAVDPDALASPGPNLVRVDAMLGIRYFAGLYGRSADVFGAMPSLHVAYPMLIVLVGWPTFRWPLRAITVLYLTTMCFAAVYLDHHWIVDVLVGLAYTLVAFLVVRALRRGRQSAQARLTIRPPGTGVAAIVAPESNEPRGR